MTAGCKEYIGASQFMGSSLVVLQLFRSQGRQSVVKTGGANAEGVWGTGVPSGVQGQSPWWESGGEAPRS